MYEYYIPSSLTSTIFLWKQMRDNGWEKRYVFSIKTLSTFHHRNNMQMHQGDKLERMVLLCLFLLLTCYFLRFYLDCNVTFLTFTIFTFIVLRIYISSQSKLAFLLARILFDTWLSIVWIISFHGRIKVELVSFNCPWYFAFLSYEKGKHICRPYIYFPLLISVPSIQSIYLRKTFTYIPSTMYSIAFSVYWK